MATLEAMFRLNDNYTRTLNRIQNGTNAFTGTLGGASRGVDSFNNGLSNPAGTNAFMNNIKKATAALGGFLALKKGVEIADDYTNTKARVDLMNDGLQTTSELQDKIFVAAERSRGSYIAMQKSVAKLGQMAGDAFGSSQEIVDFTEVVQKSFKVGGASATEQSSGMLQLTQAMASGRLQGDEFTSISENAPMISKAIADYLGKTKGELKALSSEGLITADIIKEAMFSAADDINKKFETMPKTFEDIMTSIKNNSLYAFQPVIDKFNEFINSPAFTALATMVIGVIDIIASALVGLMDMIMAVGNLIQEWWFIIEPLLLAAAIVIIPMLIFQIYQMAAAAWAAIVPWLVAHIPILIVIAVIGLLIFILMQFGVTTNEIVGFVVGIFYMLAAHVYNNIAFMYNFFAMFAEFLYNVFVNPVAAIKKLFYEMGMYILKIFRWIAKQIQDMLNAIPRFAQVDLVSKLDGTMEGIQDHINALAEEEGLKNIKRMEYKDFKGSFDKGFDAGSGFVDKLSGIGGSMPEIPTSMGDMGKYMGAGGPPDLSKPGKAVPVKNAPAAKSLNVSIDKEDIKYLKDIADRDYMVKYTQATLAPNVQITFGDVKETADANKIAGIIEGMLRDEIAVVQEGA
ncbi:MAG TPA: phage tail tape measure protein [Clostridium sp.]|nr:phage tail tape measure protein [Clostridium sp.]